MTLEKVGKVAQIFSLGNTFLAIEEIFTESLRLDEPTPQDSSE